MTVKNTDGIVRFTPHGRFMKMSPLLKIEPAGTAAVQIENDAGDALISRKAIEADGYKIAGWISESAELLDGRKARNGRWVRRTGEILGVHLYPPALLVTADKHRPVFYSPGLQKLTITKSADAVLCGRTRNSSFKLFNVKDRRDWARLGGKWTDSEKIAPPNSTVIGGDLPGVLSLPAAARAGNQVMVIVISTSAAACDVKDGNATLATIARGGRAGSYTAAAKLFTRLKNANAAGKLWDVDNNPQILVTRVHCDVDYLRQNAR